MRGQHSRTPRSKTRTARSGFTLIELMVVILIIAILASLLLVAVWGATAKAHDARTLIEIDQLAQALEAYKSKYGEYPPIGMNGMSTAAEPRIRAHLAKAFPRYVYDPMETDPTQPDYNPVPTLATLTPDQALVFWLGGMPITDGVAGGLEGFSANVADPFRSTSLGTWRPTPMMNPQPTQRTKAFFEFDTRRLRPPLNSANANFWVYVPHAKSTPYVYFPADQYAFNNAPYQFTLPGPQLVVPYKATASTNYAQPTTWVNAKTYQIIAAGSDDVFGQPGMTDRVYPSGQGYSQEDEDNLTNYSGKRLSQAKPN